ncbi:restriction endonuclease [Streptomyces evansiae]|uniref:restriction endonuclease n=1 Tax=Streptomyces evansiae TaxID=3075535 RepID=UPI00288459F1|nr:restriction endonuclease [Streptomyces sp. DSM 41859]MDT0423526.1 restriction endonuclease [Streptomyces sp. DSM 41859]
MTGPDESARSEPAWLAFEKLVAEQVRRFDRSAVVEHNQHLPGRLSGIPRQVDVLVRGRVGGEEIVIVFECKRYKKRAVGLAIVEEFIGKLHDLGADKGVLFVCGTFTDAAVRRMENATYPRISAYVYVEAPEPCEKRWEDLVEWESEAG